MEHQICVLLFFLRKEMSIYWIMSMIWRNCVVPRSILFILGIVSRILCVMCESCAVQLRPAVDVLVVPVSTEHRTTHT